MCNCGNKRQVLSRQINSGISNAKPAATSKTNWKDIPFIFTGNGHFSVQGSITGKTYFFPRNGAIQLIDYRDVPGAKQLRYLKAQ